MAEPMQQFACRTVTRAGIAAALRDYLKAAGPDHYRRDAPSADDDRLTDEVCARYAERVGELDDDHSSPEYDDLRRRTLQELGLLPSPPEYLLVVLHTSDGEPFAVAAKAVLSAEPPEALQLAGRANDLFGRHAAGNDNEFTLVLERLQKSERWTPGDFESFLCNFAEEQGL